MRRVFFISIAVAFLLLVSVTYAQDLLFAPAVNYGVGINPHAIFAADLDGDGDNDLVTGNNLSDDVSILMNNGNGTFQAAVNYEAGDTASSVVAVDLDSDGDKDLAVGNWGSGDVSILINNGNGTFQAPVNYGAGSNPIRISAADLDGDSDNDLAVANYSSDNVSILLNNGDGTFQAAVNYWAGRGVGSSFAVDLDGDGDKDLAVANQFMNNVSVLLNDGDGTFQDPVYYGAGLYPWSIFAADLDGDGDDDLAVPNQGSNNVSILMNRGNATFERRVQYGVGIGPTAVFAADLDGDDDKELAVVHEYSDSLWILKNTGNGRFQLGAKYGTGPEPTEVFSVDLDGDGYNDLAVAIKLSHDVSILINLNFACNTWHVAVDGSDETGDGSDQYPFATIQHGVDSATTGDTVLVHPGTYTGGGNQYIDFHGRSIVVMSQNGPGVTVIDGQGTGSSGFRFRSWESPAAVVDGFTITGFGGRAIYTTSSSPTIRNNTILFNSPTSGPNGGGGGGILCEGGSPVIQYNRICYNAAGGPFGDVGGGIKCRESTPIIAWNVIHHNVVGCGNMGVCSGAGIHLRNSDAILRNNTITANDPSYLPGYSPSGYGGGLVCDGSNPILEHNIISQNLGGDTLFYLSTPTMVRNFIGADPMFCDTASGDYHLSAYSPCAPANNYWDGTLIGALYPNCGTLVCGDADMDGQLTSADVELLQAYYFFQTPDVYVPVDAVDMDCSGRISLNDLIMLAGYLYGHGPTPCCAPPPPPPKRPDLPTPDFDAGGPTQ